MKPGADLDADTAAAEDPSTSREDDVAPASDGGATQRSEGDALSGDPAVMPGSDKSTTDANLGPSGTDPQPAMDADAATDEGMAHPPESATRHPAAADKPSRPQVVRETVIERKAGFIPMLLGGVAAAAIGFGLAQYNSGGWPFGAAVEDPFRAQTAADLDLQRSQIEELSARLGNTESVVGAFDVSDLTNAVAQINSALTDVEDGMAQMRETLDSVQSRVADLEKRPMEAALSPEAVAAYEREMDALRSDIQAQRDEIQNLAEEAVSAEQNAAEQAGLAQSRAAMAAITAALQSGAPFEEPVNDLKASGAVTVPDALSGTAGEGVPTLAQLIDDFPDAARAGLAAAREQAAPEEGTGRVLNFFRDQVGARSVTPREGADADAVLSRAEAELKSGDVAASLAEIGTLGEAARNAMDGWISRARTRVAAQEAAATLVQELNQE